MIKLEGHISSVVGGEFQSMTISDPRTGLIAIVFLERNQKSPKKNTNVTITIEEKGE